ncbi:MAG: response regulator [Chloroflexi bacterium]|nr:response regulator [Chloroflexota bacterium]
MATVWVVDDEPDVRELFNITITMAGHQTEIAKDGKEATEKLASQGPPDLIVLDLMMPRLDGFGVLSHIRSDLANKPVRVLVATAKVLEEKEKDLLTGWPVVGVLNKGEIDIGRMVMNIAEALSHNPENPKKPS